MNHAYWGPSFSDDSLTDLIDQNKHELDQANCLVQSNIPLSNLTDQVSEHIIDGKVIGWFQGAMESVSYTHLTLPTKA